ncbi:unnamed protein product [Pelagomonas calceolata]|uniref:SAM domain-containing protein n=2 Tax=Pelagomonas calceolata TaxID=35677 RepID=A0A8J2SVS9_9STRA|nr:unnamed protein product [Pelagomonas calceolata]
MMLGQPESVPLARSEDSFSDDGLRSEPSMGSLQELEYVDRWPSEAPPPPDDGPRTPRIGPALSLDEDDDDARVVETVDLTTPPRRREKRITGKARASRVHAVTPPAGPDAVAPFTFCSALSIGDFAAPVAGSPARSVASSGAATPTRAVTPGTPESPVDEDPRGWRRDASSSEESLVKFEEEASLVGRYLGCSVAARFEVAASDSDAEPPLPPAPPELPRSPSSNLDLWLVRRGLGKYLDAVAALGARRVSDLVFIDDDDLDALGMTPEERAAIRIHVAC